jgi:hypothetical protein
MTDQPELTLEQKGYEATRNALAILERALASMTRTRETEYGKNFHFYAEGLVEEILKLRAQIDEYIGLTAYLKEFGPPPPDDASLPLPNGTPAAVTPPVSSPGV